MAMWTLIRDSVEKVITKQAIGRISLSTRVQIWLWLKLPCGRVQSAVQIAQGLRAANDVEDHPMVSQVLVS